ncbi:MAG TPA: acyltransferase, partial [Mobilitalea sp.]|nr:acyltransferase [Mobilitalea sp.]
IMIRILMYQMNMGSGIIWDIEQLMLTWAGILAVFGLGKKYLNFNNKFTAYFSPAAFPIYYLHQSILIIVSYLAVKSINIISLQFIAILILSFIFTLLSYELLRRFSVTCFLFGIKKKQVRYSTQILQK